VLNDKLKEVVIQYTQYTGELLKIKSVVMALMLKLKKQVFQGVDEINKKIDQGTYQPKYL
jgi:hypothetical protein